MKIKRVICGLIALCVCALLSLNVAAYSNDTYDYIVLEDNTIKITSYHGDGGDFYIPSYFIVDSEKLPVSTIGAWAFENDLDVEWVIIPNTVTTIEKGAFWGCRNLFMITVPDSVTNIGQSAFYDTNLQNLDEDDDFVYIGKVAYQYKGDYNYADIEFKEGTLGIAGGIFCVSRYAGPKTVVIPDSVKTIGDWAFRGCSVLEEVKMGNGVEKIGEEAFAYCYSLKSITIPPLVTQLWSNTFEGCNDLTLYSKLPGVENYANVYGFQFVLLTDDEKQLLGDTDGDDSVTIVDATVIQRHLAEIPTAVYIEAAADADQDGQVTILDATAIQRWLAELPVYEGIGKIFV